MTQAPKPKRTYDSSRRRAAAEATRLRIAQCARRLFAKHGYGATSIEVIAREAGVSVPTFYVTYGSKRAVLFALLDAADAQADVRACKKASAQRRDNPASNSAFLYHLRADFMSNLPISLRLRATRAGQKRISKRYGRKVRRGG